MANFLAEYVYTQGRYDDAEQYTEDCEEAARANDVHSQIMWRAIRAKVLARRGEFETAERLAREAVTFAADGDFLLAHGDALVSLAEVFELAGRPEEAAAAVEEAIRLYELKGSVVSATKARSLLEACA
jgi:tetratricopeptide (TPR) repeat protein